MSLARDFYLLPAPDRAVLAARARRRAEVDRARRAKRKALRLCVRDQVPLAPDNPFTLCVRCRADNRARNLAWRASLRNASHTHP